jgi:hypothetical protein
MARPMLMPDVRTEMNGGKNADGAVPAGAEHLTKSTGARAHLRAVEAPCAVSEDEVACTLRGG